MKKIRLRMDRMLFLLLLLFGTAWQDEGIAAQTDSSLFSGAGLTDTVDQGSLVFTMPIAIKGDHGSVSDDGESKNSAFSVGIDTIRYVRATPDGNSSEDQVSYDAHATVQFPFASGGNESTVIEFRGTDLKLAGGGESRLILATDQTITIQQGKIDLNLKADSSWINLSCNGVTGIHLVGKFVFNNSFISSATSENPVEARFTVDVPDWEDMVFAVSFNTPFKLSGAGDFVFNVENAVVDFSTVSNAAGFSFPTGYDSGLPEAEMWTGFALKSLTVTLPKDLSFKESQENSISITVQNMLIDSYGLTGSFLADNVYPLDSRNSNSGINFGINEIGVVIVKSIITGGKITGNVEVPMLKDNNNNILSLGITGSLAYDPSSRKVLYKLSADMLRNQTYKIPFTGAANISINAGSYFEIGNDNKENKFGATLSLNGSLNINSEVSISGINFEQLKFSSLSPHFSCGKFGLVGSLLPNFSGFPLALNDLSLGTLTDTNTLLEKALLHINAKLSIMGEDMGISVDAGFGIYAKYDESSWGFDRIAIDSIALNLDFSAFNFKGFIKWYDDDEKYGKGFHGGFNLTLKPLGFSVEAEAYFGTTEYNSEKPYKYWYVRATADLSNFKILLFPPGVFLKSITGGAYQHMSNSLYKTDFNPKGSNPPMLDIRSNPVYEPDPNVKFGFIAGIGAYFGTKSLVSIEVQLEMAFNNNWGLNSIALKGYGAFMSEDAQGKALISAALLAYYDREHSTFHTQLDIKANIVDVIKVTAVAEIHSDPDHWWFYLGRVDKPVEISLFGLITANCYFMAGLVPNSLPPLNPKLTELFGETQSEAVSQSEEDYNGGKGFAFGVSLSANCGIGQKKGFVFAYIDLLGGTDALVRTGVECGKSKLKCRASGQAYVYFDGAAGIRIRKKYTIVQLTVATALSAELPAPYYLSGKIAFKYRVLFVKGKIKRTYSTGKHC